MFTPQGESSGFSSLTGYGHRALIVCLAILPVAIAPRTLTAENQTDKPPRELPSLTLLGNQARSLLRQEAVLKSDPEKKAAATALCDLYVILRLDDRYGGSKMLQGDATRIRRRLISIAKKKENELKREGISRPSNLSSTVSSSIAAAISQFKNKADGKNADGNKADGNNADGNNADGNNAAGDHQLASGNVHGNDDRSASGKGQTKGPGSDPGQPQQGAQAAGGIPDTGWELVELIQRIVAPDFWDSRGGPGSIRYFAMRKVLVIRATTDVHEQVRDLLTALR
jgi:hypothetical protein